MDFKDIRTSLICKLFHREEDQIKRIVGNIPYPNICLRCEPDYYLENDYEAFLTLRGKT